MLEITRETVARPEDSSQPHGKRRLLPILPVTLHHTTDTPT